MAYTITPQLRDKINHFARFPQTGVSLRQMVMFGQTPSQGTLLRATQFLADELPIRIAHRIQELENLPHNLSEMKSIIKVKNWYAQSFEELINFPKIELPSSIRNKISSGSIIQKLPDSVPNPSYSGMLKPSIPISRRYYTKVDDVEWPPEIQYYNEKFTKLIQAIKERHSSVVSTVVTQGIKEYKQNKKSAVIDTDIQAFLDRFYMSRIGIRMLIGQHVALNKLPSRPDYVGIICTKTNIAQAVQDAADNAKFICEEHYGLFRAPEIHLRAVVEKFGEMDDYPPIKVIVAEGKEDITIKISDEGGGIPRSNIRLVWTYMYTTARTEQLDPEFNQTDFKAPMAGLGYGLPISRLYARYFGGDLKLISMEGYGTDVYLHLNRISNSDEPLQ
ncbi:9466_t:CDS:10 [Dentiscutata erythropus]|uniref:Protein-serine/threonine kinase n=1 Tax=Dentiscutata erythropus TaxID=1348616 RepID=A0A9N9EKU6_9GLOM|nr:9466_t:CDS:10 [Dentiscutata erythropus]